MANSNTQLIKPQAFRRGLDLGSIHPVAAQPIEEMPAPKRIYVSLKQHRGGWCMSDVSVGDQVKMGQILAEGADPDTAPIYAPVSGKVIAVGDHPDSTSGRMTPTVTIENDEADEWLNEPVTDAAFLDKNPTDLIRAVRSAGVVQSAGGRPLASMLSPSGHPQAYYFLVGKPVHKPVDLLIINALDHEPTIAVNRRLLQEKYDDLKIGIKVVEKIVAHKQSVLAVSDDIGIDAEAVRALSGEGIQTVVFHNRYPLAAPPLLTTAVTGKELPWPGGDPQDVGALVLTVEDILGILDAVREGRPRIDRVVTVRGPDIPPRNLKVRIGTTIEEVLKFVNASFDGTDKVVVGGVMDGVAQFSLHAPITKLSRAIHVISAKHLVEIAEDLCFKCGRCVEVCPMRLLPNVIGNLCEFGQFDEAEDAELFKCIECGCCAYVCPARRPLIHYFKHGKSELEAKRTAQ
jgi:Na+-translocating ferredoxin:NAD+ oxidoreductase subunit C